MKKILALGWLLFLFTSCEEEWLFEELNTYPSGNALLLKGYPAVSSDYYVLYEYWDNGNFMHITEYKNDTIDGLNIEYFIDGELKSISDFKKGRLYGDTRKYFENGSPAQITIRDRGMILSNKRYYDNGFLGQDDEFVIGRKTYTTYFHRSTGKKYMEGQYRYDKRINTWMYYDSLGNKINEQDFGDPVGDRIKAAQAKKDSLANLKQ